MYPAAGPIRLTTSHLLLIAPCVLALIGCGADGTATLEETNAARVVCTVARVTDLGTQCNFSFQECDDQRLHELLCLENVGGLGAYDERLTCACAENRATYGTTTLEGYNCTNAVNATATLESAFRACGRNIDVPSQPAP